MRPEVFTSHTTCPETPPAAVGPGFFHGEIVAMREGAYPLRRMPGSRRVLMLGDSYLFGAGLRPEQALAAALERELNSSLREFVCEVVSLARRGTSLTDQLLILRRFLDCAGGGYQADVVGVLVNYTDAELTPLRVDFPGGDKAYARRLWTPDKNAFALLCGNLEQLREVCAGIGATLFLIHFDHLRLDVAPRMRATLGRLAGQLQIPLVDLTDTFAPYAPRRLRVSEIEDHPNAFAHSLAARRVMAFLRERSSIPSGSDRLADWIAAGARLPRSVPSAVYRLRFLKMKQTVTNAETPQAILGAESIARRDLRAATDAIAAAAAGEHWRNLLTRVRPFDGRLERVLQEIGTALSECHSALADGVCRPRALTAAIRERPPDRSDAGSAHSPLGQTLTATTGVLRRLDALAANAGLFGAQIDAGRQALLCMQRFLQHLSRLDAELDDLIGRGAPRMRSAVAGAAKRLNEVVRAASALFDELRLSAFASFLKRGACEGRLRLRLQLECHVDGARTMIVNWQPEFPLAAVQREGELLRGAGATFDVEFALAFAGRGQLSFGGNLSGVAARLIELHCDDQITRFDPACVFVPHRRVSVQPALQLVQPVPLPQHSAAWEAISRIAR